MNDDTIDALERLLANHEEALKDNVSKLVAVQGVRRENIISLEDSLRTKVPGNQHGNLEQTPPLRASSDEYLEVDPLTWQPREERPGPHFAMLNAAVSGLESKTEMIENMLDRHTDILQQLSWAAEGPGPQPAQPPPGILPHAMPHADWWTNMNVNKSIKVFACIRTCKQL